MNVFVLVFLIVCVWAGVEIVQAAINAVVRIMAHKENIERLRCGFPPIGEKVKGAGMIEADRERRKDDFKEYDEYDEYNDAHN